MFQIKFPTKRIFRIFHILRINGMAPFCNLFMERPSYICMYVSVFFKNLTTAENILPLRSLRNVNKSMT